MISKVRNLICLLLCIGASVVLAALPNICPSGWETGEGRCWRYESTAMAYDEAMALCKSYDADDNTLRLADPRDSNENIQVLNYCKDNTALWSAPWNVWDDRSDFSTSTSNSDGDRILNSGMVWRYPDGNEADSPRPKYTCACTPPDSNSNYANWCMQVPTSMPSVRMGTQYPLTSFTKCVAAQSSSGNNAYKCPTNAPTPNNRKYVLCKAPASVRSGVVNGRGSCWLGGTRTNQLVPIAWQVPLPQVSSSISYNMFEGNLKVLSSSSDQAQFLKISHNGYGTVSATPNCIVMWNYGGDGSWILEWCNRQLPFVCVRDAKCPGGYRKSQSYAVTSSGSIQKGQCTQCAGGTYRAASDDESFCKTCDPGYFGTGITAKCTTFCPSGSYCPSGSPNPNYCPQGYYGVLLNGTRASVGPGWTTQEEACTLCPAGSYCDQSGLLLAQLNNRKCLAGTCGDPGATTPSCSRACPQGSYCPLGTACPGLDCGSPAVYCQAGSQSPLPIPEGYYGIGASNVRWEGILPCSAGFYCTNGIRTPCPLGTYSNADIPVTERGQCKPCKSGYFCPGPATPTSAGSTSATQEFCSDLNQANPAARYCINGVRYELAADNTDMMTIPVDAPLNARENVIPCPSNKACLAGLAHDLVEWVNCSSGHQTVEIPELLATPDSDATIKAKLFSTLEENEEAWSLKYYLLNQQFFDLNLLADQSIDPSCKAGSTSNDGIFEIDEGTGRIKVSRYAPDPTDPSAALQYEVCEPIVNVRYSLVVRASVKQLIGGSVVANITCNVDVVVLNRNDQPIFSAPVHHRILEESAKENTPAARCHGVEGTTGCPDDANPSGDNEIGATDEDDFNKGNLVYEFVGDLTPTQLKLKINSCTGLISQKGGVENVIRFSDETIPTYNSDFKRLNYTVRVTDDGNSGKFPPRSSETLVFIYIRNVNDRPIILTPPNTYFWVPESTAAKRYPPQRQVTPNTLVVFDDDPDDTVTLTLVQNDGGAFEIVGGIIRTTLQAENFIDYESTKKSYTIGIEARDNGSPPYATPITITIYVANLNDPPVIESSLIFYIAENAVAGDPVCRDTSGKCTVPNPMHAIKSTDPDNIPTDKTRYSLTLNPGGLFAIGEEDGQITLVASGVLNFENEALNINGGTGRGYNLAVTATSDGVGVVTQSELTNYEEKAVRNFVIYVVDVNEAPEFTTPNEVAFRVVETSPVGVALNYIEILARDRDNDDQFLFNVLAPRDTLSFSLSDTPADSADGAAFFSVSTHPTNNSRARITVKAPLNYEAAPNCDGMRCYKLRIRVTDNSGGYSERTYRFDLVDVNEVPSFTQSMYTISIPENLDYFSKVNLPSGVPLIATDPDIGGNLTLTYSITLKDSFGEFALESLGAGAGFRLVKATNQFINYEFKNKYTLRVTAKDNRPGSSAIGKACTIDQGISFGCGDGAFCQNQQCYETCPTYGNGVVNISSSEVPRVDIFFCKDLTGIDGNVPLTNLFYETVETTIVIQVTNANDPPFIVYNQDRPQPSVQDNLDCSLNSVLTLGLIDEKDQFPFNSIQVWDDDTPNPGPMAGPFKFTETGGEFWDHFSLVNDATGRIVFPECLSGPTCASYFAGRVFTGTINVEDSAGLGSTCELVVTILDQNIPPDFKYDIVTAAIDENANTAEGLVVFEGFNFTELVRIDSDITNVNDPDNLTFSSTFSLQYTIDRYNSRITLKQPLDYEALAPSFIQMILVRVVDKHGADDVMEVTIPVRDVNEAPVWNVQSLQYQVDEDAEGSTIISNLSPLVSDPDKYPTDQSWNTTTITIAPDTGCGPDCPVEVVNGVLQLKSNVALDFETLPNSWTFALRVTDGGGLFTEIGATVSLRNVNEAPVFTGTTSVSVEEGNGGPNGRDLLAMSTFVNDPDASDPISSLSFEILSGDEGIFEISPSGKLRVVPNAELDYEDVRSYILTVRVSDTQGESSEGSFTVLVQNVRDVTISSITVKSGPHATSGQLACDGTTSKIEIVGTNLGFKNHDDNPADFHVNYRRTVVNGPAAQIFSATNCVAVLSNTRVECDVNMGGAGMNLIWDVSVTVPDTEIQGDGVLNIPTTISFPPPTISQVLGTTNMKTSGSETITIQGTCLGTSQDGIVFGQVITDSFVQLCTAYDSVCRPLLSGCTVNSATGTSILCTSATLPGLGATTSFSVRIAAQDSNLKTSGGYGRPSVIALSLTTLRTSGQIPAPGLHINGTNFGGLGTVPSRAQLFYDNAGTIIRYNLLGCTVTIAYTQVTCTSHQAGIGKNIWLEIEFGLQYNPSSPLLIFEAPVVTAVATDGGALSPTDGGLLVTLTGTSFGPICGVPGTSVADGAENCPWVRATYTRYSKNINDEVIIYRPTYCAVISQTQIACTMVEGTGRDHEWTLTVGQQDAFVNPNAGKTGYSSPVVGAYDGPGSKDALTSGNQYIDLKGGHFGPIGGAKVTAVYGNDLNPTEFTAVDCVVIVAHSTMRCSTGVGAGDALAWKVTVDGQESRAQLSDYGPPVITQVRFNSGSAVNLRDDGGQVLTLNGNNFGPPFTTAYLESVTYGPASFQSLFTVTPYCTVVSHESIQCTTVPSLGQDLRWRVVVRGQASEITASAVSSVRLPSLVSISASTGKTNGGNIISVTASSIGVCVPNVQLRVLFGDTPVEVRAIYRQDSVDPINVATECNPGLPLSYGPERILTFAVPEMTGTDIQTVRVRVDSTVFSGGFFVTPQELTYKYGPPSVTDVFAEPGPVLGSIQVTLSGINFCRSEACCQTYLDGELHSSQVIVHTHERISFLADQPGTAFVRCPGGDTLPQEFNSQNPFIYGVVRASDFRRIDDVTFPTVGGDKIYVFSLYATASSTVSIGGRTADNTVVETFPCDTTEEGYRPDTISSIQSILVPGQICARIQVDVPPGQGRQNDVIVTVGALKSRVDDARFEYLSYIAPVITGLSASFGQSHPTMGSITVLTVTGTNFGLTGEILFGPTSFHNSRNKIWCGSDSPGFTWSHTTVSCQVPAGEGSSLDVRVIAGGQLSPAATNGKLKYRAPTIFGFTVVGATNNLADTIGGQTLVVNGTDFGRFYNASAIATSPGQLPTVMVGSSLLCMVITSDHSEIKCIIPPSDGKDIDLKVMVAGEAPGAPSPTKFAYGPPVVYSISPSVGRTSGKDEFGNRQVLQLIGNNFGVDTLRVEFGTRSGPIVLGVRSDRDGRDDFLYPGTNHTSIRVYLPSYFGADLNVTVTVNGQKSNPNGPKFSYAAPIISKANITQPRSLAVEDVFVDNRDWTTNGAFGQCRLLRPGNMSDASATIRKAFKTSIEITSGGTYTRRFRFFSVPNYTEVTDDTCSESGGGFLGEAIQTGTLTDLGELPQMSCLRLYRDTVTTAVGYTMDNQLRPSGGVGFYIVSELKDLFLSLPTFETVEDAVGAPERADFALDDDRTATLLSPILQTFPRMLTSGCIKWESEINYRTRIQSEFLNPGASVPPRKCLDPAKIEVTGENFGSGENAPQGALRVYLVDDRDVEYEASTTSSGGNHEIVCTNEMGCAHEDTRIVFQVPFGSGRGLRVRIVLDNQNTTSEPMLDYFGPEIQEIGPGTIAEGWQFMSTTGQEVIQVLGQNLGYLSSDLSVMFNGKPCTNASWVTGFAESEGRSSIHCVAPVDVPGIKSVFVCVGGQGKMALPINPSDDVAALQYGIQTDTWNTTGTPPATSAATVRALAVSRCPPGTYGRIGEICLPCPPGGRCYPGFGEPVPEATFSLIKMLPTSPRALEGSCKKERIDQSMTLEFPEMVFYETCSQMVRCVPPEACMDRGVCSEGYEYQLYRCRNIRNDNKTDNSCRVFFDAALGVYRGVNADCQTHTALGQTCSFEHPEDCSECQVIFDSPDPDTARGECTCVQPPRCALCTATTHYRLNNECVKCPDNPALVFSLFILAGVACIALAYYLQKRKINLAFLSVGVDYFQVLAVLATTNVPWPPFIRAIFTVFSLFLASIDIAAPECLVPNLEFTTKFYLTELLPAVALAILLSIHIGYTIYKVYKLGKQAKYLSHVSRLIGIYVLIVYVLYLSLTKKALDVFNCNPLDPDDGYSYTAFSSLSCDGGGLCRCYESGGLQESLIAPAVVFLIIYTFGFPFLVAYVIFSHRENIREDQYLRANRLGERRETNPRAYDTRKRYQLVYMHFKPKYSFWMLCILARKFGVAFASLMFRGNPSFQLAVILVVLFISFTLQVSLRPYMSPGEFPVVVKELNDNSKKADEDPEQFAIYRDLFRKVQESMRVQAELIRKEKMIRHKMGAGFWEESKQAAREHDRRSVAEKYFFDLNAVEAVLLGATIIIALAGIMFESGRFATRSDIAWQADLVVVLVFIVLFGSLAYYVLVFINELWPVTFARYCGRCFLRYQNDGVSNEELDRMKDNDIILDANPLFAASGPVGDKSKSLQKEIDASKEALSLAKRQNEELKRLKAELESGGAITAANPLAIRELMSTGNAGQ